MANIHLIESTLAEVRQQVTTTQRELEDRLLANNGAEDQETAALRYTLATLRSSEYSLMQVRRIATVRANGAARGWQVKQGED
jgi:hypothetical protein